MRRTLVCLLAATCVVSTAMVERVPEFETVTNTRKCQGFTRADSLRAAAWADSVYAVLTPEKRVAQLFVPRLDITNNAAGYAVIDRLIGEVGLGGYLLGKGSVESYVDINRYAMHKAKIPALVTLDGEWGLSMRVSDAPRFPHNIALGAVRSSALMEEFGTEMARQCKLTGIHVNFAPVLDVNSNPDNPVIGFRSFGENPQSVANHGAAYVCGLENGGVMSVGKHFPGHGDTSTDSHKELARVDHSRSRVDSVDLVPFRLAMDCGMSAVMVGHLVVPSLDASLTPASLSSKITTGLLKDELGFGGLVFTDALVMKGAQARNNENVCVSALKAGADVLLGSKAPEQEISIIMAAVKKGEIDEKRIEESVKKILRYKALFCSGVFSEYMPGKEEIKRKLFNDGFKDLNGRLCRAAITVVKNDDSLLPISGLASTSIAIVELGGTESASEFRNMCKRYANVDVYRADGLLSEATIQDIKRHDVVVLAVYNDKSATISNYRQLAKGEGVVGVFFINPFKMRAFGNVSEQSSLMLCYDNIPDMREAAAEALFGGCDVSGVMPVTINGVAKVGDGKIIRASRLGFSVNSSPRLKLKLDSIAAACVEAGAFPGCQIVVAKNGKVVVDGAYGRLDYGRGSKAVTDSTLYDIASMSKAIATLPGVMRAWEEQLIDIDGRLADYIPELEGSDKCDVTLRQLLTHESGMPATLTSLYSRVTDADSYDGRLFSSRNRAPYTTYVSKGYYANSSAKINGDWYVRSNAAPDDESLPVAAGIWAKESTPDSIMAAIYEAKRGVERYLYSCLNFCLLMDVVQRVTDTPFDQWVDTEVMSPAGAWNAMYNPSETRSLQNVAPTERDAFLRKQHLQGYVHDEIAAFSGGVSGNAGLFSNALDVAKICQMWLNEGVYGSDTIFRPETVKYFTEYKSATCDRGLGFDRLSRIKSMDDVGAPSGVYGHTGFTGTCFWVDPKNELIVVFLSNRVNPKRDNSAFAKMLPRKEVMKAVYDELVHKH